MKKQLLGIALILFGILLTCTAGPLFEYTAAGWGLLSGVVGLIVVIWASLPEKK